MKVKNDHRSKFSNLSNWKEEAWKKIKALTGFEPVTSAIPVRCSTSWAMKPHTGSEVNLLSSYILHIYFTSYSSPSHTFHTYFTSYRMSQSTLKNTFLVNDWKSRKTLRRLQRNSRCTLISGWGELFSKWVNKCPGQRSPKADCVPLTGKALNSGNFSHRGWH